MTAVLVRKLKFGGRLKYEWPGDLIERAPGEWLVVHHDPARHPKRSFTESPTDHTPAHVLHYLCLRSPITIVFAYSLEGEFLDAKCDAALPATVDGAVIDFVDLDLDVVVLPGFQHFVKDQDIFAARSVSMAYSDEAKRAAHLGVLHALRLVRRRQFPFDGHAQSVIEAIVSGTPRRK